MDQHLRNAILFTIAHGVLYTEFLQYADRCDLTRREYCALDLRFYGTLILFAGIVRELLVWWRPFEEVLSQVVFVMASSFLAFICMCRPYARHGRKAQRYQEACKKWEPSPED